MTPRCGLVPLIVAAIVLSTAGRCGSSREFAAIPQEAATLLRLSSAAPNVPLEPDVSRQAITDLQPDALAVLSALRVSSTGAVPVRLRLELLPDVAVTVNVDDIQRNDDAIEFSGHVLSEHGGFFAARYARGELFMALRTEDYGDFEVLPQTGNRHLALQMKTPLPFACGVQTTPQSDATASPRLAETDSIAVIDVLLLYTFEAVRGYGACGECTKEQFTQAESRLRDRLTNHAKEVNRFLACSAARIQFHVVGLRGVDVQESGDIAADLRAWTGGDLRRSADLRRMRDALGADLVSIIQLQGNKNGSAHPLREPFSAYADVAVNIVKSTGMFGLMSLAHELAHNMGAGHQEGDPDWGGFGPASHGHVIRPGKVTIMATQSAWRVGYFSNPLVPLGGGGFFGTETANNVGTMNSVRKRIEDFRPARHRHPPPTLHCPPGHRLNVSNVSSGK